MAIHFGSKAVELSRRSWWSNVPVKGWAIIEIVVIHWDGFGGSTELLWFFTDNHLDDVDVGDINSVEVESWCSGDGDPCRSDWAWSWCHVFCNVIIREDIVDWEGNGEASWGKEETGLFNWVRLPCEVSDGTSAGILAHSDGSKWHGGSDGWSAAGIGLETIALGSVNWKNGVWNNDAIIIIEGNSHW